MIGGYIKLAWQTITRAKWRSFLTMLGVVIGVLSVVTIVSLGEGVRRQVQNQINHTGQDLITIRPGLVASRNNQGAIESVGLLNVLSSGTLGNQDVQTISRVKQVELTVPFGLVSAIPEVEGRKGQNVLLIGTTDQAPAALNHKVLYGGFFTADEADQPVAVIGHKVAEELFHENSPIARTLTVRGQKVIVRAVFDKFTASPLTPGIDYSRAIFLPYGFANKLTDNQLQVFQVLARPRSDVSVDQAAANVEVALTKAHGGQTDFTVLKPSDNFAIANGALSMITGLVATIAAISLLVGGIGIMNVMLVSVSERTHEIGVRKSVGATNKQILLQFLTEAVVISGVGGLIGVIASLLANYFLRILTSFTPVIDVKVMGLAVIGAVLVGSIFGITPALKAARKDPIEALRRL